MVLVFLGLGSNLGDPLQQVTQAVKQLSIHPDMTLVSVSRYYVSRPMGPTDQPDYVNAVVSIMTHLAPIALLEACQGIEKSQQRVGARHWGERTLDIDILCYGDHQINMPQLTIPHLGIAQRDFVLLPLAEVAPDYMIPSLGRASELLADCPSFGATPLQSFS